MLYIAEKPELARAIVEGLGGGKKKQGYYDCGKDKVAWCFGHMLELLEPEDYDPAFKRWRLEDLPLSFIPWRKRPSEKAKEQLTIIINLLKETDTAVNAGDPDAEGQLLVDEILEYAKFKGQVKRVLINDNTPALVKKAIANLRDNADFAGLSAAAEARQVGDQSYGYNLTRLYTLAAQREGHTGTLSVGRVQTPVLGLVVRRDREHLGHQKSLYYTIQGRYQFEQSEIVANYRIQPDDPVDDKGRLIDADRANAIVATVSVKAVIVKSVETNKAGTPPPLPYNLLKLQTDASRLFGLSPDRVKAVTQTLREKHRLITYNRSDSQYLSDEQHADAPALLEVVKRTIPEFAGVDANPALKSRAFNSEKVTAHHAIIPTQTAVDLANLSKDEQHIYQLIARAYLAQFMPNHVHEQTTITLAVENREFVHTRRVTLSPGWRVLYGKDIEADGDEGDSSNVTTSALVNGDYGTCITAEVVERETTPKALYSMATLLEDLTKVSQYIKDDKLRKILVEKDKGKAGEHGGIGTPATRDVILKTLLDRGFIEVVKKGKTQQVVSTQAGRDFYDALPDRAKFPDMTALWHEQQLEIEAGIRDIKSFVNDILEYIGGECARVIKDGLGLKTDKFPCPDCGKALLRRKGKNGFFWGCAGYPACSVTLMDSDGKPGAKPDKQSRPITSEAHQCTDCGHGLVRRSSKKDGSAFWGCSHYPQCKRTYPDLNGKPNYAQSKEKK